MFFLLLQLFPYKFLLIFLFTKILYYKNKKITTSFYYSISIFPSKYSQNCHVNIFEDIIPEISKESFEHSPVCLSIIDTFIDTKIYYTYEEYIEHLNLSKEYSNKHENYILNFNNNLAFKNIQITIFENKWAMFSKNTHPVIHFYTTHPILRDGLENFTPLITDEE